MIKTMLVCTDGSDYGNVACDYGLSLAERQTSSVLGDVSVTAARQPTLREALEAVNKYLYLHARGARVEARPRGDDLQLELGQAVFGDTLNVTIPVLANAEAPTTVNEFCDWPLALPTIQRPLECQLPVVCELA